MSILGRLGAGLPRRHWLDPDPLSFSIGADSDQALRCQRWDQKLASSKLGKGISRGSELAALLLAEAC